MHPAILLSLSFVVSANEAWDRGKTCEGCKWLHAKLRIDYDKLNPKVRRYGGGFTQYSPAEKAGKAVDGWCEGISNIIYMEEPPCGTAGVEEFGPNDIKMLTKLCGKLQEKYRLKAVSLLSAVSRHNDLPLAVLCSDECRKKKPDSTTPKPKPKDRAIPPDEEIQKYSVKELKRFLKLLGVDPRVIGVTKTDLRNTALAEAEKKRSKKQDPENKPNEEL